MADLIPPRRNEVVTPGGGMTRRFAEYLESIASIINSTTSEAGTAQDIVVSTGESEEIAEDEAFFAQRPQLEVKEWNAVNPSSPYYSASFDCVEAATSIVYLPQYPDLNDQVIVASNHNSSVIVYSNTNGSNNKIKIIDLEQSVTITRRGNSYNFIYFGSGYWRII